jgi:hypothetical protein
VALLQHVRNMQVTEKVSDMMGGAKETVKDAMGEAKEFVKDVSAGICSELRTASIICSDARIG